MRTNMYPVLQADKSGGVTINANTSLTFSDANISVTLADLARGGAVVYHDIPIGGDLSLLSETHELVDNTWYRVEVMLYAASTVTMGGQGVPLLNNAAGQANRLVNVRGLLHGSSVPFCMFEFSAGWFPGASGNSSASTVTCRIAQLDFLWRKVSGSKVDWMVMSDLIKFSGGTVRYTSLPSHPFRDPY